VDRADVFSGQVTLSDGRVNGRDWTYPRVGSPDTYDLETREGVRRVEFDPDVFRSRDVRILVDGKRAADLPYPTAAAPYREVTFQLGDHALVVVVELSVEAAGRGTRPYLRPLRRWPVAQLWRLTGNDWCPCPGARNKLLWLSSGGDRRKWVSLRSVPMPLDASAGRDRLSLRREAGAW
jgi:hypothetical protein